MQKKICYSRIKDPTRLPVNILIRSVSSEIFKAIFARGDKQDKDDGQGGDLLGKGLDLGNPVQRHHKNEIDVGESVKLLKQILWQEVPNCISCSPNVIICITVIGMPFMFLDKHIFVNRVVWGDRPELRFHSSARKTEIQDVPHGDGDAHW